MKRGQFMINGKDSEKFGAFIQDRLDLDSPKRRSTFEVAYGQDGQTQFDEEAYDDTEVTLSLSIIPKVGTDLSDRRNEILNLFNGVGYLSFTPYWDPNREYRVLLRDRMTFRNKDYYRGHLIAAVPLYIQPWKLITPNVLKTITSGTSLKNPTYNIAKPLIKITGTGDTTLTIGGRSYVLKGLTGSIVIDTDLMLAYKESAGGVVLSNENDKIYTRAWPYLNGNKGSTTISWSGATITKVEIMERWRVLI